MQEVTGSNPVWSIKPACAEWQSQRSVKPPPPVGFVGSSPSAGIRYFVWAVSSVLVERSLRKREVTGSSPVGSTI